MGCLTVIVSIFNVLFWIIGGTMIGLGVWILVDNDIYDYLTLTGEEIYWDIALYVIISAGAVIFLVGILGCIGACTANKCVIILYGIFVIIAVLAEIGGITVVAIFYANIGAVENNMRSDLYNNYLHEDSTDPTTQAWNRMQLQWECCGSTYFNDYAGSYFDRITPADVKVPWTCCVLNDYVDARYATKDDVKYYEGCQRAAAFIPGYWEYLNQQGCYYEMKEVMDIAAPVTLGVLSAFVLIQVIALGMSCGMLKKNQNVGPGS